jgi:hypothetical protein
VVSNNGRFAEIGVNRAVVLNVRVAADSDRRHVSPQHRIEPDAGMVSNGYITDHHSSGCDKHVFSDGGYDSVIFDKHDWFNTPVHCYLFFVQATCRRRQIRTTLPLNPPVSQAENCFHEVANCIGFATHLKVLAKAAESRLEFV